MLKAVSEHMLFGPPPLLSGKDAARYDELYRRLCAAVKPVDVIEEMLIADAAVLELDILCYRDWISDRMRRRALAALQDFLCTELHSKHYRKQFIDNLTEILRTSFPDDQARSLASSCASNESDAVGKVNAFLSRIGKQMDYVLRCAQKDKAKELIEKYRHRQPAAVEFIDKLLAVAGKSIDSFMANALVYDLQYIERIDRLIASAENRRNASLREIDRRRTVLGRPIPKTLQELEDNQLEVIEAAPAIQKDPT